MRYLIFFWFNFLSNPLLAGTIHAELTPESGSVGDRFELSVSVEGDMSGDLQMPELVGLDILGRSSSTSVSWINGNFSKTVIYTFSLAPQSEGQYQIPSISAQIDGESIKTQVLTLKVDKAPTSMSGWTNQPKPRKNAVTPPRGPEDDAQDPDTKKEDGTYPPVFLERNFSKTEVYEGEPITSEVKLYHRVGILKAEATPQGNSVDLRTFDLDQIKKEETMGPYRYNVIVVRQTLIPLKSGVVKVPPYRVDLKILLPEARTRAPRSQTEMDEFFEDFFGRVRGGRPVSKALVSHPAEIKVKPLPETGQPPHFKGLVGSFQVKAEVSERKLKAGETSTLTLTIEGVGLLDPLGKVEMDLGHGVKVYGDKPTVKEEVTANRGVRSQRIYKFALVPSHGGEIHLGKYELSYFDPTEHRYKLATADLGSLHVEGEPAKAQVVSGGPPTTGSHTDQDGEGALASTSKSEVKLHKHDLQEVHRDTFASPLIAVLSEYKSEWSMTLKIMRQILGLIFFLWVSFLVKNTFWKETQLDIRRYFRRKAIGIYQTKRKQIQPSREHTLKGLTEVYHLFREYLGHLWGLNGEAITSRDIAESMDRHKVPETLQNQVLELCVMMDRMAFSRDQETAQTTDYRKLCEGFDKCAKELKSYGL